LTRTRIKTDSFLSDYKYEKQDMAHDETGRVVSLTPGFVAITCNSCLNWLLAWLSEKVRILC